MAGASARGQRAEGRLADWAGNGQADARMAGGPADGERSKASSPDAPSVLFPASLENPEQGQRLSCRPASQTIDHSLNQKSKPRA